MITVGAWVWDVPRVLFRLGPFQLRVYGLCLGITVLLGSYLMDRHLLRKGYSIAVARRFTFYALVGFLVGARLMHCLAYHPAEYLRQPLNILKVWKGGIASHGAAVGLALAAVWFARRRRVPFMVLADALSFAAAVGATFVRIGNFFNSEVVGRVTNAPWAVRFVQRDDAWRHPSQLYEAAGGLAVLATLLVVARKRPDAPPGFLAGLFLVTYFPFRFAVEFFKEYHVLDGYLTMGQWLSIPFLALGVAFLRLAQRTYQTRTDHGS